MPAPPWHGNVSGTKHRQQQRDRAKVKGGRKGNAPSQSWTQPPGLIYPGTAASLTFWSESDAA